ncbi:MAG: HNH endonuclease [Hyphomicrobiaceae bacterium]|nr:HNH endonuclease [Hyphomicrobiaceae bacterium]
MNCWPYSTQRWQRVRRRQLAREPLCRACTLEGQETLASEVDHITPVSAGGAAFDPANLQSLCKPHHSIKTGSYDKQGKDWSDWERRGCDEHGIPRDPSHPWAQGGIDHRGLGSADRRPPSKQN